MRKLITLFFSCNQDLATDDSAGYFGVGGAQGGIRTRNALDYFIECRTGDSRAYSRPAPASRGPGYTTSTRPTQRTGREPGSSVLGNHATRNLRSLNLPHYVQESPAANH